MLTVEVNDHRELRRALRAAEYPIKVQENYFDAARRSERATLLTRVTAILRRDVRDCLPSTARA